MENEIKVGSVVFHIDQTGMFRGPGTVTELVHEIGIDFATVTWQSSLSTGTFRLTNLMTLAQKEALMATCKHTHDEFGFCVYRCDASIKAYYALLFKKEAK